MILKILGELHNLFTFLNPQNIFSAKFPFTCMNELSNVSMKKFEDKKRQSRRQPPVYGERVKISNKLDFEVFGELSSCPIFSTHKIFVLRFFPTYRYVL